MSAPDPFTTPEIDLRDLDGFLLNAERLLASELWALSTGEEFKAAMGLWCRAWKQIPAGSLPNDERVLASFAGIAPGRWAKVRTIAMRGWVLCSDGKFYHPVLCEDARRAFGKKQAFRSRGKAGAEARWKQCHGDAQALLSDGQGPLQGPYQIQETPTSPSSSVVSPRDDSPSAAATARGLSKTVETADPGLVRKAIHDGSLAQLLNAYGIPTADTGEVTRDANGAQLGEILAILDWRLTKTPVQRASGFRVALGEWRALTAATRKRLARQAATHFGLMPDNETEDT
jgi:uncharacterized protein YdaU (DUF1376 family)